MLSTQTTSDHFTPVYLEQLREELVVLAASHADRSERRVDLAQGSGVLLVHLGGHHKHSILHRVEVGNVHHRLVHHRVLGDVVHG